MEIKVVHARETTQCLSSRGRAMNSKVLLCPLTWSPIAAEPGAGISIEV